MQHVPHVPPRSLARQTTWLIGFAAALVAVLAAVPAQASAGYEPGCDEGAVCLYDEILWNYHRGDDGPNDPRWGGDLLAFRPGDGRPWREKLWLDPSITPADAYYPGGSLENRVSSYANNTRLTYCVYDRYRNGTPFVLWEMRPGTSSSRVGGAIVKGKSVNDRADFIEPPPPGRRCPRPGQTRRR